jgi:tetratricopeptide (TPR) repeat protein
MHRMVLLMGKYGRQILLVQLLMLFSCNTVSKSDKRYMAEDYVSVGIAQYKNGNNYLAINAWKEALALIPDDAEVHNFIGIAYHKLNTLDSAIAHFKRATELDGEYHQAFNNLGYAYFMKKNYRGAERCFKSSVSIKSNYTPAVANLKKIREIIAQLAVSDSIKAAEEKERLIAEKIDIAILNLNPINVSEDIALAFTLRLRSEVFRMGYYRLLDREKMKEILKKQGIHLTGCTASECLVEAGKLLHVEQIIGGSIRNVGGNYAIELRLIDIETGDVAAVFTENINGDVRDLLVKGIKRVASKLSHLTKV